MVSSERDEKQLRADADTEFRTGEGNAPARSGRLVFDSDWRAERQRLAAYQRGRRTVTCPQQGCEELVVRIVRSQTSVEWELLERVPSWSETSWWEGGVADDKSLFHLVCAAGHETKKRGKELPKRLKSVVFPREAS
jgi:hypothetical protein